MSTQLDFSTLSYDDFRRKVRVSSTATPALKGSSRNSPGRLPSRSRFRRSSPSTTSRA